MAEAHTHPHNQAREAFIEIGGQRQPAPAPRFGGTPLGTPRAASDVALEETLAAWGLSPKDVGR
jgi:alpha-methylacyl-CoA racemase